MQKTSSAKLPKRSVGQRSKIEANEAAPVILWRYSKDSAENIDGVDSKEGDDGG